MASSIQAPPHRLFSFPSLLHGELLPEPPSRSQIHKKGGRSVTRGNAETATSVTDRERGHRGIAADPTVYLEIISWVSMAELRGGVGLVVAAVARGVMRVPMTTQKWRPKMEVRLESSTVLEGGNFRGRKQVAVFHMFNSALSLGAFPSYAALHHKFTTLSLSRSLALTPSSSKVMASLARGAASLSRISVSASKTPIQLIHRRSLAGAADHHGPPKVDCWKDPMSPSKWKEEHFVIVSLSGWGLAIYGGYKFFTGGKGKKEEKLVEATQ